MDEARYVYVSSTLKDLEPERSAVMAAIVEGRWVPLHSYQASEASLSDSCRRDVSQCDFYIAIVGQRYGYVIDDIVQNPAAKSITELEFDWAREAGKPAYVFVKSDKAMYLPEQMDSHARENGDGARIRAFRNRIGNGIECTAAEFSSVADLREKVVRLIGRLREQIAKGAAPRAPDPEHGHERRKEAGAVALLCETLFEHRADNANSARLMAGQVARLTGLAGPPLLDAVRHLVEWHLLTAADPDVPPLLDVATPEPDPETPAGRVKAWASQGAAAAPIDVYSDFFSRTRDREMLWKAYFESVRRQTGAPAASLRTVSRIRMNFGFLAPQYLLAGLLARFENEWRPVLNAYESAVLGPTAASTAFRSLQASQWNCWLMWGPSIPICCCTQWSGLFAYQYGYGDENNSMPALDAVNGGMRLADIAATMRGERRGARFVEMTARLLWGPWALREEKSADARPKGLAHKDGKRRRPTQDAAGAAPAQASLYSEDTAGSLVLECDKVEATEGDTPVYFSAYLWMIFLVAVAPAAAEAQAGPRLLRARAYPEWPGRPAHLWEDVLPVFVHANIGDPAALRFHKQMLVDNALRLLRQAWDRRAELFAPDDVKAGIQFHLVCASDYSGCGSALRFPDPDPLVDRMRQALASETDPAFVAAIRLPAADETEASRPWALAGYFSACHLPELVAEYYGHVAEITECATQ